MRSSLRGLAVATDRAQDTEAIRAALNRSSGPRVLEADAALDRLVARLEAAERALADFANPQHWAIDRSPIYAHPKCVWIGTYEVSPVDHARAALAAAAPGETTINKPNEWTAHNIPEFEYRESAAPGETEWEPTESVRVRGE
jgi:hypothetical protein